MVACEQVVQGALRAFEESPVWCGHQIQNTASPSTFSGQSRSFTETVFLLMNTVDFLSLYVRHFYSLDSEMASFEDFCPPTKS